MNTTSTPSKTLHYVLWGVQALLAFAFFMAGGMKLATSNADLLANGMTWVERFPDFMRYIIGGSEVLGAIGLILPAATGIQPKLTPIAAAALALVMLIAMADHLLAGEIGAVPPTVVLTALCAFVVWGRLSAAPIAAK